MIKSKKFAFTLSEALITLSIMGILGAVVLPGVIKDTTNKANITLLQGTISHLNDAIQTELIKTQVSNIKDTLIYKNPRKFMQNNFDIAEECPANTYPTSCRVQYFNTYDGARNNVGAFSNVPTLLSNGVSIDFLNDNPAPHILVSIDLNGKHPPNIVGVDLFYTNIIGETNLNKSWQVGDVRGLLQTGIADDASTVSDARLKTLCVSGYGTPCYLLLERSGFDPKYLEKTY